MGEGEDEGKKPGMRSWLVVQYELSNKKSFRYFQDRPSCHLCVTRWKWKPWIRHAMAGRYIN